MICIKEAPSTSTRRNVGNWIWRECVVWSSTRVGDSEVSDVVDRAVRPCSAALCD